MNCIYISFQTPLLVNSRILLIIYKFYKIINNIKFKIKLIVKKQYKSIVI